MSAPTLEDIPLPSTKEEMEELLNNKESLQIYLLENSSSLKQMEALLDSLQDNNQQIALQTLALKPDLEDMQKKYKQLTEIKEKLFQELQVNQIQPLKAIQSQYKESELKRSVELEIEKLQEETESLFKKWNSTGHWEEQVQALRKNQKQLHLLQQLLQHSSK